jgi:flagellar biosynthetic protein FliR
VSELFAWIKPELLVGFFLVASRVTGIFLTAPLLSNKAVPPRVKISLILLTTLILFPLVDNAQVAVRPDSDLHIMAMIVTEIMIGLSMGFVAYLVFAAVQSAGELMGMQLGFGIATIFDPANEGAAGILTVLYVSFGALLFLHLNGHHLVLAGLSRSFEVVPVGEGVSLAASPGIISFMARTFVVAIQIAIPLLVVSTVLNVCFGFITKLSPQMNIYFNVAFIITPVIGIIVLMASLPLFRVLFGELTKGLEPEMIRVLIQMKGT